MAKDLDVGNIDGENQTCPFRNKDHRVERIFSLWSNGLLGITGTHGPLKTDA